MQKRETRETKKQRWMLRERRERGEGEREIRCRGDMRFLVGRDNEDGETREGEKLNRDHVKGTDMKGGYERETSKGSMMRCDHTRAKGRVAP